MSDHPAPRALIVLVTAASAVVTLFGLREVSSIAGPVILALVLVIAVSPVRSWLSGRGMPAWIQVAVPFLILVLVLLGMVAVLTVSVMQLATILPTYATQFQELLTEAQRFAARQGFGEEQLASALRAFDPGKVLGFVQTLLTGLLSVLSSLFLMVVLLLAMSLDAPVTSKILASGSERSPALVTALTTFAGRTRRYLVVSTVFGLICSTLDVVALALLGVPLPLLWGVLALITTYIPNIGFVLGLVPPALLALLDGGVQQMILVIVAYCVIKVVFQSFILPKYLGDAVGLSTTMTLLSLIVWTFVLGPLGALLAIPLSLLTRAVLIDSDPAARWAAALISGDATPAPVPEPASSTAGTGRAGAGPPGGESVGPGA